MPFASYEMKTFAKDWNFKITTSSPRYPQSNGQSESFVKIIKTILRKCTQDGADPNLALLGYRNTPITGMKYSPSQLLMGRQLRDTIPIHNSKLKPKVPSYVQKHLKTRQYKQKQFFDRHAKARPNHYVGDRSTCKQSRNWEPAFITGKAATPRSYYVTP